ncbi:MAG: Ca-activated chloride channel, partial [Chloroflexota bacterium]|nr:Ca-activated chloride channel [Chloroflexota bacterium]
MSFQQPVLLWALLGVMVLAGFYLLAQRRRKKFTLRFTDVALLSSVVGRRPGIRKHVAPFLFLFGAAAMVVAMAGPILNLEVARDDASVLLVIDTSGSMDATDVAPTRLDAARRAAQSLIKQLPGSARVGLVSYSTFPTLVTPLTDDRESVLSALDNLQADGGTATGEALSLAVKQLETATQPQAGQPRPPSMIVLLTDGVTN